MILTRILEPKRGTLPREAARAVLHLRLPRRDVRRMNSLAEKARRGTLSSAEREEISSYERVGHVIALLRSKARASLQRRPAS